MTTQSTCEETTVAIVGGGVAGLTAAMLLRRSGIDCVVLERQSRGYVEQRQRAGVVEYRGVRMFTEWGLGDLLGTYPADNTLEIRVDGEPVFIGRDAHAQECSGDERAGRRRPSRHDVRQPGGGPRKFFTWYRATEDLLLIMLAGQLEVEIETEKLILSAGDTLFVRGGVNHRWRQVGRARCRVLTVLHAPPGGTPGDMLGVFGGAASPPTGRKKSRGAATD
jgi:hypothetical protein